MGEVAHREARAFVEEAIRTGLMLANVLSSLFDDLPEDAFPGEDGMEVLLEMVAGSIQPAADAAGARTVRDATILLGAISDRVRSDLRAATQAAKPDPEAPASPQA